MKTVKTKKKATISEVITSRHNQVLDRQGYVSLLGRIIVLALIAWVMLTKVFLITQANGNEMFPAVKDGDLIIAFRIQKDYAKKDVVVYTAEGKTHVGRIVARESDVVTLDESGEFKVNGTLQSGEIMYPTYAKEGITYPFEVPINHIFVLGDYRTQTEDSRDFGSISMDDIEGKVITILRRRGL